MACFDLQISDLGVLLKVQNPKWLIERPKNFY